MNLAHVEYYFADLLSIIESGRDEEGWSREPIRLTYPDGKTDNPPPHEIHLPPNLYIIGTVNMDETTHAFSPKVLDRAFTIELTDVDFSAYPPTPATAGPELPDAERQALLKAFTRNGTFAIIDKRDVRASVDNHPEIRTWLASLNTTLAKHQFHFGYRVFDEIAQFIYNADGNAMFAGDGIDETIAWKSAFDHAVYMKVLPKFNGSHARLHGPLTVLLDWAMNPSQPSWGWAEAHLADPQDAKEALLDEAVLRRVATRAMRMLELVEANGFVSFG
jgi:5-methylcytosine-specific restriction enzyme B